MLRAIAAALLLLASEAHAASPPIQATAVLHADRPGATYDRHIFGQFAEHLGTGIYGGVWVGKSSPIPNTRGYRNDVLAALKAIRVPVVRWPGGCFADEYDWREGVGPQAKRPVKVNTHWGGVTEPNTFGTHEFMDFTELLGTDAYVAGNVGDATPREMAEWVEYMTSPTASTLANERRANGRDAPWAVRYFGIGNELWGCGGNMRAEYAADLVRRYATFIKPPAGVTIQRIASGANADDYAWTEVMMREAAKQIDGLGLHYYTIPGSWAAKGSATAFGVDDYARTLAKTMKMEELLTRHSAIMDKYDPAKRVTLAVDEWGTWYDPTPGSNPGFLQQQNTLRDAIVAALNFGIFARHADRVRMTNIAQMVNVLQAMILTDGPAIALTPTYHVFAMYLPFQDATVLPIALDAPQYRVGESALPAVQATAMRDTGGRVHVALVNIDPDRAAAVSVRIDGMTARGVAGQVLTAATIDAHNEIGRTPAVIPRAFTGASVQGDVLRALLPAKSVVMLDLR